MLCSFSLSSCHSLWSTGKLRSLEKPSNPLLHSLSASHHQEREAGRNSQPVSLSCCSPGANHSSLCSLGVGQLGKKPEETSRAAQTIPCLVHYPHFKPSILFIIQNIKLMSCFSAVKRNSECEGGSFFGSKPSQECQATYSPALICCHACIPWRRPGLAIANCSL